MLFSPDGTIQASPFRFPGIATELDRGLRLGIVSKLLSPWGIVRPDADGSLPGGVGLRGKYDPAADDAGADRPAG